jgi:leucyl aminopeptidase
MSTAGPAPVTFTQRRDLDGAVTVIIHDLASPGQDLAALRAFAGPRLSVALDGLSAKSAPLDLKLVEDCAADRLIVWPVADLSTGEASRRALGGRIAGLLRADAAMDATVLIDSASPHGDAWAAEIAYGAQLRAYAFEGYRTKAKPGPKYPASFRFAATSPAHAKTCHRSYAERAAGVHLARDLTNEPPNVLTPGGFAERIKALGGLGLEVKVLDRAALEAIGMGALLAVARGSAQPPFVVVMTWRGAADPAGAPLALVGKGVTFDAGGLNIKPAAFMYRMKTDMAGAAAVVGAMRALAARKAPVNAVGIVGLVENMPSADAYRPGDVLTTLSGQTVEVIDTDNEGRLVLCDLLTYAERTFAPKAIINIATLTGGARMALGSIYAPLFSNDDALCAELIAAGEVEGERLWRMPTGPEYDPMFASGIADMMNGRTDIQAHAIMGGRFLERFIERTPWAHIDMGATWITDSDLDTTPAGVTGFGAALLDRFAGGPAV